MQTKRAAALFAALAALAAAALLHNTHSTRAQAQTEAGRAIVLPCITVEPADTKRSFLASGNVTASQDVLLSAQIMGRVDKVLVHMGDTVQPGQTLVLLNSSSLSAAASQASAALASSAAGYTSAQMAANITAAEVKVKLAEAQAQLAQSRAALQQAQARYSLALAGPRPQQRAQAVQNTKQAEADLNLASRNLKRMAVLFAQGAIAAQQYDQYRAQYADAQARLNSAQQAQSMADQGTRPEEIEAAHAALLQAHAAVKQAEAGLQQARINLQQAAVSRQQAQSALAGVQQQKAALLSAQINSQYARITAPFSGVVVKRLADPGLVAQPGAPLLELQSGPMRLDVSVPEQYIGQIHAGASIPVNLDALPGKTLQARIQEIAPQGGEYSHSFLVKALLPAGSGAQAGMYGSLTVALGSEKRMLIPWSAVHSEQGMEYVYVITQHNHARMRLITLGSRIGSSVEVPSGLQPGEKIAAAAAAGLKDGVTVEPQGGN